MTQGNFLKILGLYLIAYLLASSTASAENLKQKKSLASSWAHQQIETNRAQELAGDHSPLIAIIDTGVDVSHPSIKDSLWINPGESGLDSKGRNKATNGIDDDQNGYIDDVHGWNFVTNSADLKDRHGHGTHIAGIISSVAPQSRLLILKYYDAKSTPIENVLHTMQAFKYAIQMKVQIINFSGGGPGPSSKEESILKEAEKNKILLVAAAGNDGVNTDHIPYFPADYPLSNILSVTALNSSLGIPMYANYGARSVSVAAPGDEILSSLPGGNFGEMSGTSQATAFVSGVAALILSQNDMEPNLLIEKIISSGLEERILQNKTLQATRLNAYRSLVMKGLSESAEGFQFENTTTIDNEAFIISHSLQSVIDQLPSSGNVLPLGRASALERNQL
jgi:thermitase